MLTYQKILKKQDINLNLTLLQEIKEALESGLKVRIGRKILTAKDKRDIDQLIKRAQGQ